MAWRIVVLSKNIYIKQNILLEENKFLCIGNNYHSVLKSRKKCNLRRLHCLTRRQKSMFFCNFFLYWVECTIFFQTKSVYKLTYLLFSAFRLVFLYYEYNLNCTLHLKKSSIFFNFRLLDLEYVHMYVKKIPNWSNHDKGHAEWRKNNLLICYFQHFVSFFYIMDITKTWIAHCFRTRSSNFFIFVC